MNANRRLEEFILKLSTRQNEHGLFDKINDIKMTSLFKDLKINEDNLHGKSYNKFACNVAKK
jgi:hypothetical protein